MHKVNKRTSQNVKLLLLSHDTNASKLLASLSQKIAQKNPEILNSGSNLLIYVSERKPIQHISQYVKSLL